jgi:hypothetical protein
LPSAAICVVLNSKLLSSKPSATISIQFCRSVERWMGRRASCDLKLLLSVLLSLVRDYTNSIESLQLFLHTTVTMWRYLNWDLPFSGNLRSVKLYFLQTFLYILSAPSWTLKKGPIGCPETSVTNYRFRLHKNPWWFKIIFTPRRKPDITQRRLNFTNRSFPTWRRAADPAVVQQQSIIGQSPHTAQQPSLKSGHFAKCGEAKRCQISGNAFAGLYASTESIVYWGLILRLAAAAR